MERQLPRPGLLDGSLIGYSVIDHVGRVVIPEEIQKVLGVSQGDQVLFFFEGGSFYMKSLEIFSLEASLQAGLVGRSTRRGTTIDHRRMRMMMGVDQKDLERILGVTSDEFYGQSTSVHKKLMLLCKWLIDARTVLGSWPKVRRWLHTEDPVSRSTPLQEVVSVLD